MKRRQCHVAHAMSPREVHISSASPSRREVPMLLLATLVGGAAAASPGAAAAAPLVCITGNSFHGVDVVPLLYAPLVPLLRIGLRGRVAAGTLHRLVGGVVACALGHAGYIMLGDSTMGLS